MLLRASPLNSGLLCMQVLRELEVQHAIGAADSLYCPHKDCSALLVKPEEDVSDEPSECPECGRVFCATCKIPGWHKVGRREGPRGICCVVDGLICRSMHQCHCTTAC